MQADPEPPEAQALHRALGPAGLQGGSERTLKLFAPEPRFEGYPWYDALARVTGIETLVTVDGAVRSLDYFTNRENGGEPERPETIVMHLNVLHPPKSPRHCFRKCGTIAVPADLAFAGEAWSSLHDALPLVTADNDIAPEELARLLRAAYFSPSDDADADSWETQLTRFEEEALHMSLKLMCSVEEARQRTIADAVWREIFWLMPRDRTVTIVVRGGKVSVDIGPVCTEAATDAGTGGGGTMTHYTVCCGYASHYHNTVTVEADTLDEALEKAIEQAGDDPHWKSVDQASQTFVEALAEGMDADPWGDTALPVPDRFTEKGEAARGHADRPPTARRHRGHGRHRPYSFRRRRRHRHDGGRRSAGPAGQQASGHDRTQSRWRSGCGRQRRPCTRAHSGSRRHRTAAGRLIAGGIRPSQTACLAPPRAGAGFRPGAAASRSSIFERTIP